MSTEEEKEADESADRRDTENNPMPWWWLGQKDPIARFTKWLAIYTLFLVLATAGNAIVLIITDHTLTKTMINGQRAYVAPKSVGFGIGAVTLEIENSGQTPAEQVRIFSNWQSRPRQQRDTLCKTFSFPEQSQCQEGTGEAFLNPKVPIKTRNLVCDRVVADINKAFAGEADVILYGNIFYSDIFKHSRRTSFCFILAKDGADYCSCHNEMDAKH